MYDSAAYKRKGVSAIYLKELIESGHGIDSSLHLKLPRKWVSHHVKRPGYNLRRTQAL